MGAEHDLYIKAGARNFVLVDVPPIGRSPGGLDLILSCSYQVTGPLCSPDSSDEIQDHVGTWNDLQVRPRVSESSMSSPQATVFVFSSHKVLTNVLDDPLECDLGENDPDEGGAIWEDDLHLKPVIHAILADRFFSSLKAKDQ